MAGTIEERIEEILRALKGRHPGQEEFMQAVEEVLVSLKPLFENQGEEDYLGAFSVIAEPERVIKFRVQYPTFGPEGAELHTTTGYRVQFNSALGPYKGGLRFHPSVSESIIKFLGFEQIFKNALTNLPIGGGKGGCVFDPKGKSDSEVRMLCEHFMKGLYRHIGPNLDVPAGDIGVGGREIGYMYGEYVRLKGQPDMGVLTGKSTDFGGSKLRPEATGYGLVYITLEALKKYNHYRYLPEERRAGVAENCFKGLKVLISGSGNVAQFAAQKVMELGGQVCSFSDSTGTITSTEGFSEDQLKELFHLKNVKRGRVSEMSTAEGLEYHAGKSVWELGLNCDIALPSATQNEITLEGAKNLAAGGCWCVAEGANMPTTNEAVDYLKTKVDIYIPAKAANAGGVATSALEMAQNSARLFWSSEEVDEKLNGIMTNIFATAYKTAQEFDRPWDLQFGANAAGFLKVYKAYKAMGYLKF
ncbi:NADP-specific glutamate dehydrogenase-like [Bolinopsis microptera]|uniref:NADP-specific glutamate dehydrogenase-like n=1 Tax=Bolinopsis microptera TaxID=2820187 RepID=UPI00307AFF2F